MLSTRSGRLASALVAAALVGAGLLASAPANAEDDTTPAEPATPIISVTDSTFTLGSWGDGLEISGTGFEAGAEVTLKLWGTDTDVVTLRDHSTVVADDAGSFSEEVWLPDAELVAGDGYSLNATEDEQTFSNTVDLIVLAPAGIITDPTTLTTRQLADTGVAIHAAGFAPGEIVSVRAVYAEADESDQFTADINGVIGWSETWHGTLSAGTITYTLTGAESGHVESATVAVTGETITVGGGGEVGGENTPPTTKITLTTPNLPKVSG